MKWGERTPSFVSLSYVLAAVLFALGALALTKEPAAVDQSPFFQMDMPTPESLEDLVAGHGRPYRIIAVAVVQGVEESGEEPTPTYDPAWGTPESELELLWPPMWYTLYDLGVERVLLDDGTIASGQPLTLYRVGLPGSGDYYPMEEVGERYLYFLDYYDGHYYPGRGPYSRLIVDGEQVTYSDGLRSPVWFAEGTPPSQFIDAVATAVATQYATPTP